MKFTPVNEIPKKRCEKHRLQLMIEEFIESGHDIVRVDINEHDYKSPKSCYSCLHVAAKRSKYSVKVKLRGDVVYLTKNHSE